MDTNNNSNDFFVNANPNYGLWNNTSPVTANTLNYPSAGIAMPKRSKVTLTLGTDSSSGTVNSIWFIRTGGATDTHSPHIYRLTDLGFDLSSLTQQTTQFVWLNKVDIDGNYLISDAVYRMILNTDTGAGSSRLIADNITIDTAVHTIDVSDIALPLPYANDSSRAGLLKITINNNSAAGRSPVEFTQLKAEFMKSDGLTPLTTAEAKELWTNIFIVTDNLLTGTTDSYQSAIDVTELVRINNTDFTLEGGRQTINITNPDSSDATINAGAKKTFFLGVDFTVDASSASVPVFRVKIVDNSNFSIRESISDVTQDINPVSGWTTSSITVITPIVSLEQAGANVAQGPVNIEVKPGYNANSYYIGAGDGKFYSLDINGSPKWTDPVTLNGTPKSQIDSLYTGESETYIYTCTDAGTIYKIQDNGLSGQILWQVTPGGSPTAGVVAWNNLVYLGTTNNRIFRYTLSGSVAEGWTQSEQMTGNPVGVLSIDDYTQGVNAMWIGTNAGKIYRISTVDGTITSNPDTLGSIYGSPYETAGYSDPSKNTHYIYFGSDDGKLYCRKSDNLSIQPDSWTNFDAGAPIRSGPSPSIPYDKHLYFGCDNGKMYKIDATSGTIQWEYQTNGKIRTDPIAIDINNDYIADNVYFGSDDGCFYALNAGDGQLKAGFPILTGAEIRSSPRYQHIYGSNSRIIFGSNDGKLYYLPVE